MRVLAIDTSSSICSVAIVENGEVVKGLRSRNEKEHSENLMPMVDELFKETKLTLNDIDVLACGVGPGSFTGIRVGIATIKALSDSKDLPVVEVNSLEALAYSALIKQGMHDCKVLSMIDARNDNVYYAIYRVKDGNLSTYKNPGIRNITETMEFVNLQEPLYLVGDVNMDVMEPLLEAEAAKEKAEGREDPCEYIHKADLSSMAEAIGIAATHKYEIGLYGDSRSISPMYLRRPQAEREHSYVDGKRKIWRMSTLDLEYILNNYDEFPNLWDKQTLKEDYQTSSYIIAKLNNEIVGFLSYRIVIDEMEILNIVTRRDRYNIGIASSMLSYLVRTKGTDKINLEVSGNNTTALRLYKQFGFNQVGLRKNYYSDGSDAILMSL